MKNTDEVEYLILVNEQDQPCGKMEKSEVHRLGLLHRAFSIFVFNSKGEILLQQRADAKYHSPGLWSNTCCSHPHFGEELKNAVERRLMEEMGLALQPEFVFSFIYQVKFDNGLIEHEFDHVYFCVSDIQPKPDNREVKAWKYIGMSELENELEQKPLLFTAWLRICFNQVLTQYEKMKSRRNP